MCVMTWGKAFTGERYGGWGVPDEKEAQGATPKLRKCGQRGVKALAGRHLAHQLGKRLAVDRGVAIADWPRVFASGGNAATILSFSRGSFFDPAVRHAAPGPTQGLRRVKKIGIPPAANRLRARLFFAYRVLTRPVLEPSFTPSIWGVPSFSMW